MDQALNLLYTKPIGDLSFVRIYEIFYGESHRFGALETFSVFGLKVARVERKFLWTRLSPLQKEEADAKLQNIYQEFQHRRLCLLDVLIRPLKLKWVDIEPLEVVWKETMRKWHLFRQRCLLSSIPMDVERTIAEYF